GVVRQRDRQTGPAPLVALETLLEAMLELPGHTHGRRVVASRQHLAEERERRGHELSAGFGHALAARKPLRLFLLPLDITFVDRRLGIRAEQHLEAPLELFEAGGERNLPHLR